jgi:hypothetical protein
MYRARGYKKRGGTSDPWKAQKFLTDPSPDFSKVYGLQRTAAFFSLFNPLSSFGTLRPSVAPAVLLLGFFFIAIFCEIQEI